LKLFDQHCQTRSSGIRYGEGGVSGQRHHARDMRRSAWSDNPVLGQMARQGIDHLSALAHQQIARAKHHR